MLVKFFRPALEAYWGFRLVALMKTIADKNLEFQPDAIPVHVEVVLQRLEGSFLATVPQMPGIAVDGVYLFETIYITVESILAYLRSLAKHGEALPTVENRLVVEAAALPKTNIIAGTFWTSQSQLGVS